AAAPLPDPDGGQQGDAPRPLQHRLARRLRSPEARLMASFVRAAALAGALPPVGGDWMKRAESIARTVAATLKQKARLEESDWQGMPCVVGSSSHFIGAREAEPA